QRRTAIEDADVVHSEKAAMENVHAVGVFTIDPPGEIQQQLLKHSLQKNCVTHTTTFLFDLVNTPGGPCVDRRIDITERPLVCGQLTIRVHVPLAQHQQQLILCKIRIDEG